MKIGKLLESTAKQLQPKKITCPVDKNLGWLEAEMLLGHVLKQPKAWLLAHDDESVSTAKEKQFNALVSRRKKHEPVAYIVGRQSFYGRDFDVNRNTLIPRPESELFIDILKQIVADDALFWDVGSGSGAIGVTLALEFPGSHVIATDNCRKCLKVAEKNAATFDASDRMSILHADLLSEEVTEIIDHAHLPLYIVANLPYVPDTDLKKVSPDIRDFEPKKAIFAKEKGMAVIKKLLGQIHDAESVNPEVILLEFDSPNVDAMEALAGEHFPTALLTTHNDLAGRPRLLEIDLRA